jgi:hypothetical protein
VPMKYLVFIVIFILGCNTFAIVSDKESVDESDKKEILFYKQDDIECSLAFFKKKIVAPNFKKKKAVGVRCYLGFLNFPL